MKIDIETLAYALLQANYGAASVPGMSLINADVLCGELIKLKVKPKFAQRISRAASTNPYPYDPTETE